MNAMGETNLNAIAGERPTEVEPRRVSVLIPVYNCGPYLDEALWSVRRQTYSDFEVVVVNDGSTDDSLAVLRRHADEDSRIVVLDRPNGGIVVALNAGLAACRGELIARMDGDDVTVPNRLALQVEAMDRDPSLAAVGGQAVLTDAAGRVTGRVDYPLDHGEIDAFSIERGSCGMLHPTTMFRTSVLREVGGYRDAYRYAEDLDLYLRLAERHRLANLAQVLLRWRRHDDSVCTRLTAWQARSGEAAIRDAARRRGGAAQFRRALSDHAYRASWLTGDEGKVLSAARYALKSWARRPLNPRGPRALVRALVRGMSSAAPGGRAVETA